MRDSNGAPRWYVAADVQAVKKIEYIIDLKKMEIQELSSADASILRSGYGCILNYSVFGWVLGKKEEPVELKIIVPNNWPIFCTSAPTDQLPEGEALFSFQNYSELADAQIQMGPDLRVQRFDGLVPLYVTNYSETDPGNLDVYGDMGVKSLKILKDIFGELPFEDYTIVTHALQPIDTEHEYNFSMEHLKSMTHFMDLTSLITDEPTPEYYQRRMFTILHHISHAFVPMRCYGDTYSPYVDEIPKIINNIWFNEGFAWYICLDKLNSEWLRGFIEEGLNPGSPVKDLPLEELSKIGSFIYGRDFRFGKALCARGATMAKEMNDLIVEKTAGKHSMETVLRYFYQYVKKNGAYSLDEFVPLIKEATGVNVSKVYKKWTSP
jgi:predicted metalloprotease with PDZ domain